MPGSGRLTARRRQPQLQRSLSFWSHRDFRKLIMANRSASKQHVFRHAEVIRLANSQPSWSRRWQPSGPILMPKPAPKWSVHGPHLTEIANRKKDADVRH